MFFEFIVYRENIEIVMFLYFGKPESPLMSSFCSVEIIENLFVESFGHILL